MGLRSIPGFHDACYSLTVGALACYGVAHGLAGRGEFRPNGGAGTVNAGAKIHSPPGLGGRPPDQKDVGRLHIARCRVRAEQGVPVAAARHGHAGDGDRAARLPEGLLSGLEEHAVAAPRSRIPPRPRPPRPPGSAGPWSCATLALTLSAGGSESWMICHNDYSTKCPQYGPIVGRLEGRPS